MINWLKKANAIDTSGFVFKAQYTTENSDLENKIPSIRGLVKKQIRAKINGIKGKIPKVTGLATTTTALENKKPSISHLFKNKL